MLFKSGFRSERSTTDNLVGLDVFIKEEHVVAVFFDLEITYYTTCRFIMFKYMQKLELQG